MPAVPSYGGEQLGMVEDFDAMFNDPLNFDDLKGLSNLEDEYDLPVVAVPDVEAVESESEEIEAESKAKVVEAIKVATATVKAAKAKKVIVDDAAEKLEEIVENEESIIVELVKSVDPTDVEEDVKEEVQEIIAKTIVHSGAALADLENKEIRDAIVAAELIEDVDSREVALAKLIIDSGLDIKQLSEDVVNKKFR